MGGFGSGRYGGTATAEGTASYVLAASVLTRARLQVGQRGFGTSYFGEEKFPVEIRVDTTDASNPFLELTHRTRDDSEGDRIVRDRIRLIWTVPTYGGRRWWFLCPRTGRRTIKLFLPIEGMAFLEPPSLWPRLCLPARRSIWSGSTEGLPCSIASLAVTDGAPGARLRQSRSGCAGEPTSGNTSAGSERPKRPTRSSRYAPRAC